MWKNLNRILKFHIKKFFTFYDYTFIFKYIYIFLIICDLIIFLIIAIFKRIQILNIYFCYLYYDTGYGIQYIFFLLSFRIETLCDISFSISFLYFIL